MFLQTRAGNGKNYEDGGYDYVSAPMDTWDSGSLCRMHMIRQQAAIDLTYKPEEGIFIKEQDIDDWLIANHEDDEATLSSIIAEYEATLKMVSESNA